MGVSVGVVSLTALLAIGGTEDDEASLSFGDVQMHGFISQGYLKSNENNYIGYSRRGTAQFFEAALNTSVELSERLRGGLQLIAFDNEVGKNFEVALDWAFLDYRWFDELGVRAGRYKQPLGLFTEVWDVDIARVPLLLPSSVYAVTSRDVFLAASGLQLYGRFNLGGAGALSYNVHGGSVDIPNEPSETYNVPWGAGGRLIWEAPLEARLRIGASTLFGTWATNVQLDSFTTAQLGQAGIVGADFDGRIHLKSDDFITYNVFAELAVDDLTLAAEGSRTTYSVTSSQPAVIENPEDEDYGGFYGLATYRFASWFAAGAYASFYYPNLDDRDGSDPSKHTYDYALTARFDMTSTWAFKLEGHYFDGTARLTGDLNRDPSKLEDEFFLLAARTTLAF